MASSAPTPTLARHARLGPAAKLRLVAEILEAYAVVRWRMREPDIRTMVARLRGDAAGERRTDLAAARRLGRGVARTLSLLPTDNRCLARSLVLDRLLARRSLASVLVVAVDAEPEFLAHAWVEHGGVPVLPPGAPTFKRMIEL